MNTTKRIDLSFRLAASHSGRTLDQFLDTPGIVADHIRLAPSGPLSTDDIKVEARFVCTSRYEVKVLMQACALLEQLGARQLRVEFPDAQGRMTAGPAAMLERLLSERDDDQRRSMRGSLIGGLGDAMQPGFARGATPWIAGIV